MIYRIRSDDVKYGSIRHLMNKLLLQFRKLLRIHLQLINTITLKTRLLITLRIPKRNNS